MARMNDDDSEFKDDPNLDHSKLPGVKQSSYSGPVPTTDYSAMGGSTNANSTATASSGFGAPASTGFGSNSGFGATASGSGFGSPSSGPSFGSSMGNAQPAQQQNLTAAGSNAAQGADVLVAHNKDWINKKWRPVMGWVYMATCTADFVVFPVLWSLLQAMSKGSVTSQWQPLTLQGAGLYHIAMGAVLGIAAYGRTKEKLEQKQ
jgi:hypothetical protein